MLRILRALLVSGVATAVAAAVLGLLSRRSAPQPVPPPAPGSEFDGLAEAEQEALLRELAAQL